MADRLKPFFCYKGGKWRLARYYPIPEHSTIVEPFAGAAGYSTWHHERKIVLVDKDPIIAGLWSYLIHATAREIRRLPLLGAGDDLRNMRLPQEAKWLIGFWLDKGGTRPANAPSPRMVKPSWQHRPRSHWGVEIRERIATQVEAIRHWKVREGSYDGFLWSGKNGATWFIDPPYQVMGTSYTFGSKTIDYAALARWCRKRDGQVIVCENDGATWLPFKSWRASKATHRGGATINMEAVWMKGGA